MPNSASRTGRQDRANHYQEINDKIIAELEAGGVPWVQPWGERALWTSKSDKLIEDAQRDWSALGQERLLVTPLARFRQGTPIRLDEGILFITYATLRSDVRKERVSRLQQIVDWVGSDFDGVIVFDESHAMANAAGNKGERGDQAPSQQVY